MAPSFNFAAPSCGAGQQILLRVTRKASLARTYP
ncbi:hypothetical protein FOCG_17474 [Fusarium oxysporum f. sp. radicis-lycopersici 26381]|uniref:Uncharacterized protein n=3 Tax=Fusarium oxysporum TaxID=5507 RepID=X0HV52_FUSOX|nr:hypothetical protein FOZG_18496 [Fusarium oxysporum Fo47]EXA29596.1 hypothetical protein FOVG_18935 [Fusarium oxysporum f. sp. pisi HDV247]EXL39931.1 hypothetical protein FOCG_17474 [Fusarium oxysporum f. sp. radicis-lycopersici 26381]EXL65054.1 hypothetical protein FOPG_18704 [Fusarium oxysporum f. sp. conglutinans race 2 54008]